MKDSMFTLKQKLDELQVISDQEIDWSKHDFAKYPNDPLSLKMKEQERLMDELKVLAKENNTLLGRVLRFQMADSHALYVVTRVFNRTVRVTWVDWCDGWQDDRLGVEGTLDIDYVQKKFDWEDKLTKAFSK